MGIIITVLLVVTAFLVGFWQGYDECFNNEILPRYEEKQEGDDI